LGIALAAILMVSSFYSFYKASVTDWHYHIETHYDLSPWAWTPAQYSFGSVHEEGVIQLIMNQNDSMVVESQYVYVDTAEDYNECRVVLKADNGTIIAQSPPVFDNDIDTDLMVSHPNVLSFTNYAPSRVVDIIVTFPSTQANLTEILAYQQHFGYGLVYVDYDHYAPPDWFWFSGGVVLGSIGLVTGLVASIGLVAVHKSRKQPKLLDTTQS
jgi:hypothetical protein